MPKRPHRRDRRRTPPNVPGGNVFGLSVARDAEQWSVDEVILSVSIASATLGTPGYTQLDLVAGNVSDLSAWDCFEDGISRGIDGVTIDPAGVLEVRLGADVTGLVYLIIPAFVPELTSVSGITCAGGIIFHDYTP